jgi:hypothetical protein
VSAARTVSRGCEFAGDRCGRDQAFAIERKLAHGISAY